MLGMPSGAHKWTNVSFFIGCSIVFPGLAMLSFAHSVLFCCKTWLALSSLSQSHSPRSPCRGVILWPWPSLLPGKRLPLVSRPNFSWPHFSHSPQMVFVPTLWMKERLLGINFLNIFLLQNSFLSSPVNMFLHGVQEEDVSLPSFQGCPLTLSWFCVSPPIISRGLSVCIPWHPRAWPAWWT